MSSTTAATTYTSSVGEFSAILTPKARVWSFNHVVRLPKTKPQRIVIRSSSNDSIDGATASVSETATATEEVGGENAIEVPKAPPSLISAINVEKALRGIPITDADHYARLGLQRGCLYDQVLVAYNIKVEEVMGRELDEEELNKELDLLKESYTILSSVEDRRLYDWSLGRSANPERYTWPFEADITHRQVFGVPPPQEPENVGPTRIVGYFLVGWFILGITLSIALNR